MKLAGILLVFVAAAGLGMYASMELRRRKKQLIDLKNGLVSLEREIDYQIFSLPEAFVHTADRTGFPWNQFFDRTGRRLKNQEEQFPEVRKLIREEVSGLKKKHPWIEDLEVLSSLGNGLGELDKKMQLIQIQGTRVEVEKKIQEAEAEEKQKGRLYQSLGICMGAIGAILLL